MCVCVSFLLLPCIFDTLHRIFYDFIAIFPHEHSVGYVPTVYSFFSTTARLPARSLAHSRKTVEIVILLLLAWITKFIFYVSLSLALLIRVYVFIVCSTISIEAKNQKDLN